MKQNFRTAAIILIACLFSFFPVIAQQGVKIKNMEDLIPLDPKVKSGKLENGLKYYVLENKKPEKRMFLRLVVSAGAILEDNDQDGLAHFCEHMAFNGTKNFPKHELLDFLESTGMRFGADINAYTNTDETVYMIEVPTDSIEKMEKGFQILEDWAYNVSYEDVEIDKERGVIQEEWRLGKGAEDRIQKRQMPVIYYKSKYAERDVIGDTAIINNATHETLRRFYKDWYRPELMAVIAIGDFNADNIIPMIKTHFSRVPVKENPRKKEKYNLPDNAEPLISIEKDKELAWPMVTLVFKHPKRKAGTYSDYRQGVVERLFDQMLQERIEELRRKADPPFVYGYVGVGSFAGDRNAFYLGAVTKPDGFQPAYETLLTEAFRAMKHGFTPGEFERAKKEVLRSVENDFLERDKTESDNLVWAYQSNFLDSAAAPGVEYRYELYKKWVPEVKLEEVNALTTKFLHKDNSILLAALQDKENIPVPEKSNVLATFNEYFAKDIPPYVDKVASKPLFDKKLTPGKVTSSKEHKDIGVSEWSLSNGMKVFLKPTDFKNDEIQFRSYALGGSSNASDEDFYSASFASSVVNQSGLGSYSQNDLIKELSGKIVGVYSGIGELSEGISGSCSPADVETMFQMINLQFTEPRKDEETFNSVIEKQKAQIRNRQNDPENIFRDTMRAVLSQYHKRAMPITEKNLEKVNLDKLFDFYKERFANPGEFTFFFIGNFKLDSIKPFVEKYLASLPSTGNKGKWKDVGIRPPKGDIRKEVYKGIEAKSQVMLVFSGDYDWNLKNNHIINTLSQILNYRLLETVREEKSGTYGAYSYCRTNHYPQSNYSFYISFGCDPKRVDELISTVFDILDSLRTLPPKELDITKAKQTQRRERETNLKENDWWLGKLYDYSFNNVELGKIMDEPDFTEKFTPAEIQAAANKYFNKKNFVRMVLYPASNEK